MKFTTPMFILGLFHVSIIKRILEPEKKNSMMLQWLNGRKLRQQRSFCSRFPSKHILVKMIDPQKNILGCPRKLVKALSVGYTPNISPIYKRRKAELGLDGRGSAEDSCRDQASYLSWRCTQFCERSLDRALRRGQRVWNPFVEITDAELEELATNNLPDDAAAAAVFAYASPNASVARAVLRGLHLYTTQHHIGTNALTTSFMTAQKITTGVTLFGSQDWRSIASIYGVPRSWTRLWD